MFSGAEIGLGQESVDDHLVVAWVFGDMIIVNHHAPESTSNPPVVRTVDIANASGLGGSVALVVGHCAVGNGGGDIAY